MTTLGAVDLALTIGTGLVAWATVGFQVWALRRSHR